MRANSSARTGPGNERSTWLRCNAPSERSTGSATVAGFEHGVRRLHSRTPRVRDHQRRVPGRGRGARRRRGRRLDVHNRLPGRRRVRWNDGQRLRLGQTSGRVSLTAPPLSSDSPSAILGSTFGASSCSRQLPCLSHSTQYSPPLASGWQVRAVLPGDQPALRRRSSSCITCDCGLQGPLTPGRPWRRRTSSAASWPPPRACRDCRHCPHTPPGGSPGPKTCVQSSGTSLARTGRSLGAPQGLEPTAMLAPPSLPWVSPTSPGLQVGRTVVHPLSTTLTQSMATGVGTPGGHTSGSTMPTPLG